MQANSTIHFTRPGDQNTQVIQGCIETLQQGHDFLVTLGDEQYCYLAAPHVASAIGGHFRHLLDVFYAIYSNDKMIDYNLRRRGHRLETCRYAALEEVDRLIDWLSSLNANALTDEVTVITEVALTHTEHCAMKSTLGRELTFASLHATHHFAMSKVVVSLLDLKVDSEFGYAPATVTYLRSE